MQQPSRSRRARKHPPAMAQKTYQVQLLQELDYMPIHFHGRVYDLANLTADELAYLLGFPEQVPYLKKIVSQAD